MKLLRTGDPSEASQKEVAGRWHLPQGWRERKGVEFSKSRAWGDPEGVQQACTARDGATEET